MKKILFLALVITSFWSCETVVDIDLPEHKPMLVMNGVLATDSTVKVKLTHSKSSLDDAQVQPIQNATVTLMLPGGQVLGTLTHTGSGYYELPSFYPVAGTEYVIEAAAPNYKTISAADAVPASVQLVSYTVNDSALDLGGGYYMARLDLTFTDPGDKNYYSIEMLRVDTFAPDTPKVETIWLSPANGESSSEQQGINSVLVDDEFFNGKTYTVGVMFDSFYLNNMAFPNNAFRLQLNLKSISRHLYLYEKTYNLQLMNSGNPFAEPVRVHSNVTDGFGILGSYSMDTLWVKK